ncbi:MAG: alpha amylase C-terminal domain-containing protein [Bacteroidales bacterium]|nr:alpha amylase C-terminal domain-containing protein [Bacteroidales bacterium]
MDRIAFVDNDPYLENYSETIRQGIINAINKKKELLNDKEKLSDFANGHRYFGLHKTQNGWVCREWAPNASMIIMIGERMGWDDPGNDYHFKAIGNGVWELHLSHNKLYHKDIYKLLVKWDGGEGHRIPIWVTRVVQDENSKVFNAQVWLPDEPYSWKNTSPVASSEQTALIYEAHVGMSSKEGKVNTYIDFADNVIPRIVKLGYNTIQLMAIQEHPYYGSFGYHVSNIFAASSRFGTPDELRYLIDTAHGLGLRVIMDIVHSHVVKNTLEGPGLFDGQPGMYFHTDHRREHPAWDSLCFDYGRNETLHLLLSNCKYWLDEYHFDGFRFDGVTSMLYFNHGLGKAFNSYDQYFDSGVDQDALVYLRLTNELISEVNDSALTIAEDMSGMPGLAVKQENGGIGFTYRLSMGIPDFWIRYIKEKHDEEWNVNEIFHELTNKRQDEKTISYTESHDQALVGDKTIIFRLADKEMYTHMSLQQNSHIIDRAISLHKMLRLITLSTSGGGYLNFMGNEFGHPEWVDFPREGNNWSYHYARRQWNLAESSELKYQFLNSFDKAMIIFWRQHPDLSSYAPQLVHNNETDQVIAFARNDYIFIFNFNPRQSFKDYGIHCEAADYQIALNSDKPIYGGYDRIDESVLLESVPLTRMGPESVVMTYLPNRTAIIIKKIPTLSTRDKH